MVAFVFVFVFYQGVMKLVQQQPGLLSPLLHRELTVTFQPCHQNNERWKLCKTARDHSLMMSLLLLAGSLLCRFTLVCEKGWSCPALEGKAALKKQSQWTGIYAPQGGKGTEEGVEAGEGEEFKEKITQKMSNGPRSWFFKITKLHTILFNSCWNLNRDPARTPSMIRPTERDSHCNPKCQFIYVLSKWNHRSVGYRTPSTH